jgi:gliding motility-associated-like protein
MNRLKTALFAIFLLSGAPATCVQAFAGRLTGGYTLVSAISDDEYPSAEPVMKVETPDGEEQNTEYSGSAPIVAHFTSNVTNLGNYTPLYEWHVYEAGKEDSPYLIRYDADFDYTFVKSGTSYISLNISFVQGQDTISYSLDTPFQITASESVLQVPNAFSPNGDGTNDVFKVKDGYKSIIEFHGYIFNRWGKKLFEWKDISQGWDGRSSGHDVPDGVYFCRIDAKGADGKVYKIRKAINLLRSYLEGSSTTTASGN